MADEVSQSAGEHFKVLTFVVSVFGRSMHNFVALIGDNKNTNQCFSKIIRQIFVSFYTLRFNLAVKDVIKDNEENFDKVHDIMCKFSYLFKTLCYFRALYLTAKLSNGIHWNSTYELLKQYCKL